MRFITLYMLAGLGIGFLLTYAHDAVPLVYWGAVILSGICLGYLIYYYGIKIRKKQITH
jgi:uncharacterized membrane protein